MEPSRLRGGGGEWGGLNHRDRKIRDRVSVGGDRAEGQESRRDRETGRQKHTQKSQGQGRVMRKRDKEGEKHGQQQPDGQMYKYRERS